jgi:hypothetical protein
MQDFSSVKVPTHGKDKKMVSSIPVLADHNGRAI